MKLRQISVFVENKIGALTEVTGVLKRAGIDIRAFCLADTADFGIIRLIVDKPQLAVDELRAAGQIAKETEVLGVKVQDTPGAFHDLLTLLADSGISVEYSYAFLLPDRSSACVIMRVHETAAAIEELKKASIQTLCLSDLID